MGLILAEGDVFWKSPTVYDVAGMIGLLLGIGSIWLALRLARHQFREELRKAELIAVNNYLVQLSMRELAEGIRHLRECGNFLGSREWDKAILRLDDVIGICSRLSQSRVVTDQERTLLAMLVGQLRDLGIAVRDHKQSKQNRTYLPANRQEAITRLIIGLEIALGRISNLLAAETPSP